MKPISDARTCKDGCTYLQGRLHVLARTDARTCGKGGQYEHEECSALQGRMQCTAEAVAAHCRNGPDFITFVRHQMSNNDNQRVTQNNWVFLGGAKEKMYPLHHVRTQEAQSFRLYKCGSGQ